MPTTLRSPLKCPQSPQKVCGQCLGAMFVASQSRVSCIVTHGPAIPEWKRSGLEGDLLALEAAAATATAATATPIPKATAATTAATEATATAATAAPVSKSTTTAATATEAATTTTAAAAAIVRTGTSEVQTNTTAHQVGTLQLLNNGLGVFHRVERDVAEALEATRVPNDH